MSEQTPDTNNGMSDGQDPSMEDILASIRKIIADDEEQGKTPLEMDDESLDVISEGDLAEQAHEDTLDLDIVEEKTPVETADIDALIGDMDAESSNDFAPVQLEAVPMSQDIKDDVLDLEIPMDEAEPAESEPLDSTQEEQAENESLAMDDELAELVAEMDDDIVTRPAEPKASKGLVGGAMAALGLGGAAAASKAASAEAVEPPADDLSLMLDNMLEDSASYEDEQVVTDERVIDPGEDLLAQLDLTEDEPEDTVSANGDPDMDLVKSLMADLTEEPLHADEVEVVEANLDIDDEDSADNVMDEILSITLDDEAKLSEELEIPEMDAPAIEQKPSAPLSLKEIAAQADADAQNAETNLGAGLAAAAGLGVVGATAMALQDDEADTDAAQTDDVDAALSQLDTLLDEDAAQAQDLETEPHIPDTHIEETSPMPRAVKTDAIIDEVTETATAGAFASLSSVVEEKATVAERGDRIGDLVMEALQPMLKEWLDKNLKGIVERAVTKEVKRISSGK